MVAESGFHIGRAVVARSRVDVDDAHEGICAVACARRTANDLDVIDVIERQRQVAPGHLAKIRAVDRAPVDEHLKAARIAVTQTVIREGRKQTAAVGDGKSRHQPEHIRHLGKARGTNHVAVDHGNRGRGIRQRLREARRRQHNREVVEKIGFGNSGQHLAGGESALQQERHTRHAKYSVSISAHLAAGAKRTLLPAFYYVTSSCDSRGPHPQMLIPS